MDVTHKETIPLTYLCKMRSVMIRRVKAAHTNPQPSWREGITHCCCLLDKRGSCWTLPPSPCWLPQPAEGPAPASPPHLLPALHSTTTRLSSPIKTGLGGLWSGQGAWTESSEGESWLLNRFSKNMLAKEEIPWHLPFPCNLPGTKHSKRQLNAKTCLLALLETVLGKFVSNCLYHSASVWKVWINSPWLIQPSNPAQMSALKPRISLLPGRKG